MRIIEDSRRIDIASFKALDTWTEIVEAGSVNVRLECSGNVVSTQIGLTCDMATFGRRWLFSCPRCETAHRHLYIVDDGQVLCFRCGGLLYWRQALPSCAWRREVAVPVIRQLRRQGATP